MAPNTPAVTPNFWRNSCPEAQLCSFDLPNLQQSSRNQRQATGNSLPRPFSAGSPTMFNASVHSQFATSAGAQPSDTFRNLLRSPGTRRSQGLMRGLWGTPAAGVIMQCSNYGHYISSYNSWHIHRSAFSLEHIFFSVAWNGEFMWLELTLNACYGWLLLSLWSFVTLCR